MRKNKIVTAQEAVSAIKDGDVIAIEGFVGSGTAEALCIALGERYATRGEPKDLTLIYSSGPGDAKEKGLNHLAQKGLFKRVIAGHFGLVPKLGQLALENAFEAYNFPQGILTNFYRAVAGNRPGFFSKVGLGTFVDPRIEGGKTNDLAKEDLIRIVEIDGEEWIFMKTFPIDVCFIRGTTADTTGNISMEKEVLTVDALSIAMATRNSGGLVIAQVERVANPGTLHPKLVKVPSIMVDHVVVAEEQQNMQTFATQYNPSFAGELRIPMGAIERLPLNERTVIARRANFELRPYYVINLGIGVPEGVANIANEEKILDYLTMTVEPGIIGGMPTGGLDFGGSINPQSIIDMPDQFDFYDGGGLDLCSLGMAQCDEEGNVNSSKFGPRLAGCGGFVDISQCARKTLFVGTFTAGGLKTEIGDGQLRILQEGKLKKFVKKVDQITFSGKIGSTSGQEIFYLTERCVFKLIDGKVELIEVAPGVDIEKDILAHMEFTPVMNDVKTMDPRIFTAGKMGIRDAFLTYDIDNRIRYMPEDNTLFLNFKGLELESLKDIDIISQIVEEKCQKAGRKVNAIVNYDSFNIDDDLMDAYLDMGQYIIEKYYAKVTRYSNREEMRKKLGGEFVKRALEPNIFETENEALGLFK